MRERERGERERGEPVKIAKDSRIEKPVKWGEGERGDGRGRGRGSI